MNLQKIQTQTSDLLPQLREINSRIEQIIDRLNFNVSLPLDSKPSFNSDEAQKSRGLIIDIDNNIMDIQALINKNGFLLTRLESVILHYDESGEEKAVSVPKQVLRG